MGLRRLAYPRLELGIRARPLDAATVDTTTVTAFRDGYIGVAGGWPTLDLASFAVAVTSWLNWTYNTICEAIDPADKDHAAFAEREATDLVRNPLTRSSLEYLLTAVGR